MPEYIEREAAIKGIMNDAPEQVSYSREDAADCIRYMDAADVAPVRHGRWKNGFIDTGDGPMPERAYLCGQCGKAQWRKSRYCPNCGARMDGDNNA